MPSRTKVERGAGATGGNKLRRVAGLCLLLTGLVSCANVGPRLDLADPTPGEGEGQIEGIVTSAGVPVSGIQVRTIPGVGAATTDRLGRFTISGVQAQKVILSAAGNGFHSSAREVQVLPGRITNGDLEVAPSGDTGNIVGKVTVDGVNGLPAVTVLTEPPTQRVETAFDGSFSIVSIPPGRYRVVATRDGFQGQEAIAVVTGGDVVRVALNATRRSDGTILGLVTDGTQAVGDTLDTVTITLLQGTMRQVLTRPLQERRSLFPLPPLFPYEFGPLTTGRYVVQAELAGFVPGSKEVEVVPPRPGNGEIILTRDRSIGSLTGTIFDPTDFPEPGAVVSVGPAGQGPTATTVTGLDGRFALTNLTPGIFDMSVAAGLFTTRTVQVTVTGGNTAEGSLKLQ